VQDTSELASRYDVVNETLTLGGRSFELLHPRSAEDLLSEEEFAVDERIPYWAEVWPSARVLAERLVAMPGTGRRCLELGCGAGWCAVAALAAGFDLTATDYYTEALEFVRYNAARNQLPEPAVRMVDWRKLPDDLGTFDLVAAADVLYERPYAALVAEAIHRTLSADGTALVTDPGRQHARTFVDECTARGLRVSAREQTIWPWDTTQVTVDVYELRRE
jgi:predicted nicotinamide N-methyase